ncbi:AAA family ATPase [Pseudogemmobacter sonorensis]|uniref:AAA family ATPase n=1 Tax=Pseudogemmobacter sonorensis TaxID=2989681 RepID=UPI0036CDF78B
MARTSPVALSDFGDVLMPAQAMEPILARPVRSALLEWLTEIWAADDLADVGLSPRRRALFFGAPGTGKTTLAHHLAARLGLPMLAVRSETIVDCWLGSTGRNIGSLFAAAKEEGPCILFIDEFDALAPKRQASARDAQQERNASVNTLLQRIEQHDGIIIAATNLSADIDQAIWRRFDIQIELALPGPDERHRILARYLAPYGLPSAAMTELAEAMSTASPSLMRQFCESLKRNIVLGDRLGWDMRRAETVDRILSGLQPHKDLGKPRLWAHGSADRAIGMIPWPLPMANEIINGPVAPDPVTSNVISMGGGGRS